ncbi:MAG: folate-binding protein [Pseudomonadota bacterium]
MMSSYTTTRTVLRVSGADAADFLQGQFSNDINAVTPNTGQLSALSTPKGRVVAVFRILRDDEGSFLLTLPADIADEVLATLRRYVLRSKVVLELAPDGLSAQTHCEVPGGLEAPDQVYSCTGANGTVAMRLPGAAPLYEIVTTGSGGGMTPPDSGHIARTLVAAGVPDVGTANTGAFVAQMLNLDQLDGISFKKGCYTGQEVIARTQNLGRIKRRMLRFAGAGAATPPAPGDSLAIDGGGDAAGRVVSAAPADGEAFELLAVMRLDAMENGAVTLADGTPLTRLEFD